MVTQALPAVKLPQKRLHEVDTLKFLAIIGVVIIHMGFKSRFSAEAISIINALQALFAWAVLAFFFCSGLLLKPQKIKLVNLKGYILSKAQRLLFPCIIFSVSYKILQILLSSFNFFSWSVEFPVSAAEWISFLFSPIGPQFYFLIYLFLISTLFFVACLGTQTIMLTHWGLIAFCLAFYLQTVPPIQPHGPSFALLPLYAFCFSWGVTYSAVHYGDSASPSSWVSAAFVLFLSYWHQSPLFAYALIPVGLYLLLQKLPDLNEKLASLKLGDKASGIYVWHAPFVLPFCSIVTDRAVGVDLLEIPLNLGLTIGICGLISTVIDRVPILRMFRF